MAQKENIDILLLYIHKLDEAVTQMKGTEIYPASFFDQTMELTSRIMEELHLIESDQIEALQKQLEAHQALLQSVTRKERSVTPIVKEEEEHIQNNPHSKTTIGSSSSVKSLTVTKEEKIEKEIIHAKPQVKQIQTASIDNTKGEAFEPKTNIEALEIGKSTMVHPVQTSTLSSTTEQHQGLFLNDILEKKNLSDFKKAFSLNDRFRFRRELFNNNEKEMELAINDLNAIQSYDESINYLNNELKWDMENQAVKDFILLLEKRFL